jgi:hypothetical protein
MKKSEFKKMELADMLNVRQDDIDKKYQSEFLDTIKKKALNNGFKFGIATTQTLDISRLQPMEYVEFTNCEGSYTFFPSNTKCEAYILKVDRLRNEAEIIWRVTEAW